MKFGFSHDRDKTPGNGDLAEFAQLVHNLELTFQMTGRVIQTSETTYCPRR
jgi:hypothetical protein